MPPLDVTPAVTPVETVDPPPGPLGPPSPAGSPTGPRTGTRGPAWLRAVRPRQWPKNALVLAAPLAGGRVLDPDVLLGALVAFAVFCVAASGCYLLNDALDAPQDRLHPTKRLRPVAAGEIGVRRAVVAGTVLMLLAVVAATVWALPLGLTVLAYVAVQAAYLGGVKDEPALDLAVVSSGFLLRAIAGGTASGLALSPWFLLVATFGALFVVSGKRYSEMVRMGADAGTRPSLRKYSASYLRFVWTMAAGVTVTVYLLWALNGPGSAAGGTPWAAVSVAPFVLCLMRYAAVVDRGHAERPEEIVLGDRHLQVIALVWVGLVATGAVLG
ncbi:decaprenyl-phosphate phosphoribosyltransferase [Marmoricola sp. Leaf446]|uniref:decaprenyl-phosphate phosphoribosyltransferase n=1 Tax=Marmoricola sp. Leaf446 TaxID=1736379 RepID=UPI0009EB28DC|nr:decaprenyl-phosphate phosphoribosyltransferase [Marmoricola sp. Leaf446]